VLEHIDLEVSLARKAYERELEEYQVRLHALQRACDTARISTLVVFEGWDAAGKGTAIRKLTERLEPRAMEIFAVREARTREKELAWLARFWAMLPSYGSMAIFDRSWYGRVLVERMEGLVPETEWRRAYGDITSFEQALADDRYLIIKFFFHISREEQARRLAALQADPARAWQVQPADLLRHERYDEWLIAFEEMLLRTDAEWAPWTIVEGTDGNWARIKVFRTIAERMERELVYRDAPLPDTGSATGKGKRGKRKGGKKKAGKRNGGKKKGAKGNAGKSNGRG
jgi:polyphosphate kinase 2 (PPK2 family)